MQACFSRDIHDPIRRNDKNAGFVKIDFFGGVSVACAGDGDGVNL
jgi:hypothetical protein